MFAPEPTTAELAASAADDARLSQRILEQRLALLEGGFLTLAGAVERLSLLVAETVALVEVTRGDGGRTRH